MMPKFIVVEGLEGAGKTTALDLVVSFLRDNGVTDIKKTREPGGTPLAEIMRTMVKDPLQLISSVQSELPSFDKHDFRDAPISEQITDASELLLMYAARSQLIENIIKPSLSNGYWVVGDRHDLSSQAYQGGGRQLDIKFLTCLKEHVIGSFKPDLTLYLDIDPQQGLSRVKQRGALDRIELSDLSFFERTRARYQELAAMDSTIKTIDAQLPIDAVSEQILTVLSQWFKELS